MTELTPIQSKWHLLAWHSYMPWVVGDFLDFCIQWSWKVPCSLTKWPDFLLGKYGYHVSLGVELSKLICWVVIRWIAWWLVFLSWRNWCVNLLRCLTSWAPALLLTCQAFHFGPRQWTHELPFQSILPSSLLQSTLFLCAYSGCPKKSSHCQNNKNSLRILSGQPTCAPLMFMSQRKVVPFPALGMTLSVSISAHDIP